MDIDVVVLARFLLTGIAILLGFLAVVAWSRRKDAPEAEIFAVLSASMAVYAFGYAGEVAQTELGGAERWLDVEYLAVPWAGALWVLAACKHNGLRGRTPLLFILPILTFAGHFTNFGHLFYSAPAIMVRRGPFEVLVVYRGPLAVLESAFLLVSFVVAAWVYLWSARHASTLARKQAAVLAAASVVPFLGYFVYLAGVSPWGLDTTPAALGVTCALLYYGIFQCGMLELAPLARNLIFNSMRDGVLILDTRDRLLDFNPAAKLLLPVLDKRNLGAEAMPMLAGVPSVADAVRSSAERVEVSLCEGDSRSFEVSTWPLLPLSQSAEPRAVGRAVIFAEVTAQVQLREELRRRAETDVLTGIANRGRFHQALEIECMRFTRGHAPFSVLLIDLDFFKSVNDRFGHPAGDAVLKRVAELLLTCLRKTDLPARYGGEEFSVLLPETRLEGARIIAERIRCAVCGNPIVVEECPIPVTVSIGVASHANDLEAKPEILLKKADVALYRAKTMGRNRVELS